MAGHRVIDRHFLQPWAKVAYRLPMWGAVGAILAWVFAGWTIGFPIALACSAIMIRELHAIAADPTTPFKA